MNDTNQNNLVSELVSEMQRTNPPHVFNVDNNGNPGGSSQGQFPQGGLPNPNIGNNSAQINPQLQQQFMYTLKQNPQLMQMFQNPESLQQALQNPQIMINTIAQHQQSIAQMQSQQMTQNQPNLHNIEQIQNQTAIDQEEEEDDDVNPDQMLNLQGPIQYDDDIGDVNIPQKIKGEKNTNKNFTEKLTDDLKGPLIATLLFLILTQSNIRDFIIKLIPKIQDSSLLQTLTLAGFFLILNYLAKKLLDMV